MKTFKDFLQEDGVGGAAMGTVQSSIAGTGSPELSASQREPGVNLKKKKTPVIFSNPVKRKGYYG